MTPILRPATGSHGARRQTTPEVLMHHTRIAITTLTALCLLCLVAAAQAHVEPTTNGTARAGAKGVITMNIEHGCEDAAGKLYDTDRIVTQLPKGFTGVTVPAHAGWTGTATSTGSGTRVQWTTKGAKLGRHTMGRFSIGVTYPTKAGTYGLPTIQYCAGRSTAWIEKPVGGVEPDLPLPTLVVK